MLWKGEITMENRKYVALSVVDGVIEQISNPIDESELKDESLNFYNFECFKKDEVNLYSL